MVEAMTDQNISEDMMENWNPGSQEHQKWLEETWVGGVKRYPRLFLVPGGGRESEEGSGEEGSGEEGPGEEIPGEEDSGEEDSGEEGSGEESPDEEGPAAKRRRS